MILSCPSCSAQYFADDKAIGENGRTVRCAACAHSWFAKPELSLEEEFNSSDLSRDKVERIRKSQEGANLEPALAFREKEFAKRQNSSRLAAVSVWGVSAAIFFGLGAGAIAYRDDVVKHWPQSSSAFALAGLETNRFGLEFGPIEATRTLEGTTPVLNLTGLVKNTSEDIQTVPVIKVDIRDDMGRDVDSVLISLDESELAPGTNGKFLARIDSPPLDAFDLAMSFVEPDLNDTRLADLSTISPSAYDATNETSHDDANHSEEGVEEHH